MEIIVGVTLGLVISFLSTGFYALGVRHGKQVKDGCTVNIEPYKAITEQVNSVSKSISDKKERKELSKHEQEFSNEINKILSYNGERN